MSITTLPPPSPHQDFWSASLYVGDLEESVTDGQLYQLFAPVASVVSVRVCRDHFSKVSLGYGYANFKSIQDAHKAMETLNFTPVNGKPIRLMLSHRDRSTSKCEHANVFIKNLDSSIDNKALYDTFAAFGVVLSCKVATDCNGQSKGYGFVQFEKEESAHIAIKSLNGTLIRDKHVYVGPFVRRQERNQANGSPKFTKVYVKHFCDTTTDEDLKKDFGKYGPITSAAIMRDADGKSRGFGFVNFQNPEDAVLAVEKLNGAAFDDKVWYVCKAQSKGEKEASVTNLEQGVNGLENSERAVVYLKNLDESVTDQSLKGLYSKYITSCKVVLDPQGQSWLSGFVAFSTYEEANKAAHYAQPQTPISMAYLPTGIPVFYHGGHSLAHQQLYYGQGPLNFLPQIVYGFQQQLLPSFWPGAIPKYIVPYPFQQGFMSPMVVSQYHNHRLPPWICVYQTSNTDQTQYYQSSIDDSRRPTNQYRLRLTTESSNNSEEEGEEGVCKQGMLKTEMCKNWETKGSCVYEHRCQFAHGIEELRPIARHPCYKTKICQMIKSGRACPYGRRCHFLHPDLSSNEEEKEKEVLEPEKPDHQDSQVVAHQLFDRGRKTVIRRRHSETPLSSHTKLPLLSATTAY